MLRMEQLADRDDILLSERQWELVIEHAGITSVLMLQNQKIDRRRRIEFLKALGRLVTKIRRMTPNRPIGTHIFWDTILSGYLDRDPSPELRDAFHAVLGEQLRSPDKRLQRSALYGLNYLSQADSRVADLVASLRSQLADDEVREFADAAVRGDLW